MQPQLQGSLAGSQCLARLTLATLRRLAALRPSRVLFSSWSGGVVPGLLALSPREVHPSTLKWASSLVLGYQQAPFSFTESPRVWGAISTFSAGAEAGHSNQ